MKKFLVYLALILVVVSMGFGAYYLFNNEGGAALSVENVYVIIGDKFEIDVEWEGKAFTDYEALISNTNVVTQGDSKNQFVAVGGGHAIITFRLNTTNAKYRNLIAQVFVGDGSSIAPFYIGNANDFLKIGNPNIENNKFTLDKAYELLRNINLVEGSNNTGYFVPIGAYDNGIFTGTFNGRGNTISNVLIDTAAYNVAAPDKTAYSNFAGLFARIGESGFVYNIKIDNLKIQGSAYHELVGTITGHNKGKISRTEIIKSTINIDYADFVGGAVGINESSQVNDSRFTARVDRVSANVIMGAELTTTGLEYTYGIGGVVGGLVGSNLGGIVVYSYAKGIAVLSNLTSVYGGIVGINNYITYDNFEANRYFNSSAGNLKDNYSIIEVLAKNTINNPTFIIGGVIGQNHETYLDEAETATNLNKIIGNYYSTTNLMLDENNIIESVLVKIEKDYKAIGVNYKNAALEEYTPQQYALNGLDNIQLKYPNSYISHVTYEVTYDQSGSGNIVSQTEKIVKWKFNYLWFCSDYINEGYPYLNYENIDITDEINTISDGQNVKSYADLLNMAANPSGHYVLVTNIDMSPEMVGDGFTPWVPIGTMASPFTGTFEAGSYIENGKKQHFSLSNLQYAPETATAFGGLFGVLADGEIRNVIIKNANISNANHVGVLAGTNGFTDKKPNGQGGFDDLSRAGSRISNVRILGAEVSGLKNVGGIVGQNFGTIRGSFVDAIYNAQNTPTQKSIINLKPDSSSTTVGGLVGINHGTIERSFVLGDTTVFAGDNATSGEYSGSFTVFVGGIAGENNNKIQEVKVELAKISIQNKLNGSLGGLVGLNKKNIYNSITSGVGIYADPTNIMNYAGGIVGSQSFESYINIVGTYNTTVTGYTAGGLVGIVSFDKQGYTVDPKTKSDGNAAMSESQATISNAGVNGGVVSGTLVGGAFGRVTNGFITDVYAVTSVDGISKGSNVAGLVGEIEYYISKTNVVSMGLIQKAYVSIMFGDNGSKFAVSKSDFLMDPLIGSRSAGYIYNYLFNDETDGNAKHPYGTWDLWGLVPQINKYLGFAKYAPSTTAELKGTKKFTDFSFSNSVWNFENTGELASIKAVDNININITTYKLSWNISSFITLETDIAPVQGVDEYVLTVNTADTFTFKITLAETVDPATLVVFVNGSVLNADEDDNYNIYGILENIVITFDFDLLG